MKRFLFTALLGIATLLQPLVAQVDPSLDFLRNHTDYRTFQQQLSRYEQQRAFALLDAREAAVAKWTAADAAARKAIFRERFINRLGGFPEKTPLNPRVLGTIEAEDYRIEKIVFESQPKFYVTANLYLPKKGKGPYPAILFPLGHENGAKAHDAWQQVLVTFVRKGYVCLTWDPLGQGERIQLLDPDLGDSKVTPATSEHTVLGMQTLLAGDPLARYTIWDGIRALDYLVSRPEVDVNRIGCTGNSGGGTHTAYLSSLDDRIKVAAPSCFITSWRRLLQTIGPQDAEQCVPGFLSDGLDHADFIHAFSPKPYMMMSAIRDFFSITGARETYAELKKAYELVGASEKMQMIEADDGHGYTHPRRVAAYRWFDKWLKGIDEETPDTPVTPRREEELFVTMSGQVLTEFGGETVTTLNQARVKSFRRGSATPAKVRELIGYEYQPGTTPAVKPFGVLSREGYRVEKFTYLSEEGIEIPAVLYVPEGASGKRPAVVYASGSGKSAVAKDAESLVAKGLLVMSLDLRGLGESRNPQADSSSNWARYFGDYNSAMTAMLTGRTLTGGRATDISRAVDVLMARNDVDKEKIYGAGEGTAGVAMLHAAAVDSRIRRVALDNTLESYQAVVDARVHQKIMETVIPGVLRHYDLPDLAQMLGSRQLVIVDPANPMGKFASIEKVSKLYSQAKVLRRNIGDTAATLYGFSH